MEDEVPKLHFQHGTERISNDNGVRFTSKSAADLGLMSLQHRVNKSTLHDIITVATGSSLANEHKLKLMLTLCGLVDNGLTDIVAATSCSIG